VGKRAVNRITLVCVDTLNHGAAVASLRRSMDQCEFGEVLFFSNVDPLVEGIRYVPIEPLRSKNDYSRFILKELWKYIDTDFVLITQHDGYVLDGLLFDGALYDYDYTGALWPWESDGFRNGNGGFSLRSKRLLEAVGKDEMILVHTPEDAQLCRLYRPYLEKTYDLKWAPDELCEGFSFECGEPVGPTFGFHSYFHTPYQPSVVIRRQGALGDVIAVEPVLKHFHKKGYRVHLDTHEPFEVLFQNHYFPVHSARTRDKRVPAEFYNLDMAYESKPKQLHLKSYFEFCGISDYVVERPRFYQMVGPEQKMFERYAILHLDIRQQPHRNVVGVNWDMVVDVLNQKGYTVFQLGEGEAIKTKAIRLKTPNFHLLKWVVGSADLFVGIDSGIAAMAVAFGVPAKILVGSVDLDYIHPDMTNVTAIENREACDTPKCWHSSVTQVGQDCVVDKELPPCSLFDTASVIKAISV